MVNAFGLTNPGPHKIAFEIRGAMREGFQVIPNLYPQFSQGLEYAIQQTIAAIAANQAVLGDAYWIQELNVSCGNSKEKIGENMGQVITLAQAVRKKFPWLKTVYKINYDHPYELPQELERQGLMDVCHSINSILYSRIYGECKSSPLYGLKGVNDGGSVSGGAAFKKSLTYTKGLRLKIKSPIAMGCGIMSADDVKRCAKECIDLRHDSLVICTMGARKPLEASRLLMKYNSVT
jgi:dihydroorotate dehydrogenase (NAD+) catalytic subunit